MSHEVCFMPSGKRIAVRPGTTILEAARKAAVHISSRCDAKASCLMCKVTIAPEWAKAAGVPTEAEKRKLDSLLQEGQRLSCQARAWGPLVVTVPEDPLKAAVRRQLEKQQEDDDSLW